ncbi:MAG TPA: hypothetical protein PK629_11755 [Oscillospiraceae bacterium]|nr:hypothetical protein [Oscillospiraceae bacterium]HPK36355.1 hypothetical protein [Oscillospiraceae bacterium]
MKIKNAVLLIVLAVLTFLLVSCESDAKELKRIPAGFIKLTSSGNYPRNSLSFMIKGKRILINDVDGTCIYQTKLSNSDFIVQCDDVYYVSEGKYLELFDSVTVSKIVDKIPSGFVKLSSVDTDQGLRYGFGKTDISFFTSGGTCIYKTELSNSDFIVIYKYEYYIDNNKYSDMVKMTSGPEIETKHTFVQIVQTKPDGFIQLVEAANNQVNGLNFMFFENYILFFDCERVCIFVTENDDPEFIVEFKDEFFVNEKKFSELVDAANKTVEQRDKIYSIDEEIELRGCNYLNGYNFKIDEVKAAEAGCTYTIKFVIRPGVTKEQMKEIFDHVETNQGTIINEFNFIGESEVQINVPAGEKINIIYVKSPDYSEAIRKISVE